MKIKDIANAYWSIKEFSDSIGGYTQRAYLQYELEELEKYLGKFIKEATKDEKETFKYLCKKCERYDKADIVPEHFNPIEESFSFLNKCIEEKFPFAEEPFNKSTVDKFLYAGKFITENCVKLNEDTFIGQMKELNLSSIMNKVSKDLDKMKDINEKIKELENTNLTKGEFDIKHLKKINKLIGCKGYNLKGIKKAKLILKQLKNDNYLKGFKKNQMNQFGKALTDYYNELRKANVFKEANTFTARLFIKELARENGYSINIYKEYFSLDVGLTRINKDNELEILTTKNANSCKSTKKETGFVLENKGGKGNEVKVKSEKFNERLMCLIKRPIKGKFNESHLRKINHFLTGNKEYEQDGMRRVNELVVKPLKKERYLKGMDADQVSSKLAEYYFKINDAKPFEEGNIVTAKEFVRELAAKNGYELNINKVDFSKNVNTQRSEEIRQLSRSIKECFTSLIPDRALSKEFEKGIEFNR